MKGGWKCTVEHYTAGEQIGVAVAIETTESNEVSVITVFMSVEKGFHNKRGSGGRDQTERPTLC